MPELSVIGVNHRTAGVALREQVALPGDLAARLLGAIHDEGVFAEALILDTCNRTEFYVVPRRPDDPLACLLGHIGRLKSAPPADRSLFYRHDDREAVRHLMRVAASLDSQIVGEHEILGQVKNAYRLAVEARTAGFLLNRLLHAAFRAGKRVRTETDLGRGSAGVPQAAVELARHLFSTLEGKTVLLVGAGQTAQAAARALLRCGAGRLIVANRTVDRARQLAEEVMRRPADKTCEAEAEPCGGDEDATPMTCPAVVALAAGEESAGAGAPPSVPQAAPLVPTAEAVGLDAIAQAVTRADLVLSSTGSPDPVLTFSALAPVLGRRDAPLLVIDIAVPRDVDERLGQLPNVFLYNLDDLDRLVSRNLDRRRGEIPRAEAIVEDEVEGFWRWLSSRQVAPTIRLLQERLASIEEAQIERYGRPFADRQELERFSQGLVGRILHRPLAMLKELSTDGSPSERAAAVDMIRRLFDLDSPDPK